MSEPRSGYFSLDGVRIHYLDWGGNGGPIVILHATGLVGRIYGPIAKRLSAVGHVYTMDQRGHGDSDRPPEVAYNWYATLDDLKNFVERLGHGPARGFGHSSGATAIGSLTSERPDLISCAVLVEPVLHESAQGPETGWRNPLINVTVKRRKIFDNVGAMYENYARKLPFMSWNKDVLRDFCEYGTRPTANGKRELKCPPEIEVRYYQSSNEFDGLSRLLSCDAPILAILGGRADALGGMFSARLKAGLRNGRVIDFPDGGHFLPMERPSEVAKLAAEFFAEQGSA